MVPGPGRRPTVARHERDIYSYVQIDRPLAKNLHKADLERTTCGPQYFMMRMQTAIGSDMTTEVRTSPPKSAPRDFSCEGPIDLKVAVMSTAGRVPSARIYWFQLRRSRY